jgi:hypothetical protein
MKFNKLAQLLLEMPISTFEKKGDWSENAPLHMYDKSSTKMLNNPNYAEKVKTKWSKIDQDIDMYFVRSKQAKRYREIGEISPEFVKEGLGLDIPINDNNITIIFTNNVGDEKVPLTPWIIAHRFAHALARIHKSSHGNYSDAPSRNHQWNAADEAVDYIIDWTLKNGYGVRKTSGYDQNRRWIDVDLGSLEQKRLAMANVLGTFKSARDNNLRQPFELTNELIAQFIIEGQIRLNTNLPQRIPYGRMAWGKASRSLFKIKDQEALLTDGIERAQSIIAGEIESMLMEAVGKIFVM